MPTFTTHFDLAKPLVNNATDQDLWGGYLNGDMDTIDSALWTAQRFISRAVTTTDSATTADNHKILLCDATASAFTETLPAAADAGDGFTIAVKKIDASTNAVTVDGNGAELIDGAATFALSAQYAYVVLVCNGTGWNIVSKITNVVDATTSVKGIVQLATSSEVLTGTDTAKAIVPSAFAGNKSLATDGYYKLPGGLMIQWGAISSTTANTSSAKTFPTAFTTIYQVTATPIGTLGTADGGRYTISGISNTGFTVNNGYDAAVTGGFFAVGLA